MNARTCAVAALLAFGVSACLAHAQPAASVVSARLDGRLDAKQAIFDAEIALESLHDGWAAVRLFPADAAIVDFKALKRDVRVRRTPAGCDALVPGRGRYKLRVRVAVPVTEQGKQASIALPLPNSVSTVVSLRIPGTGLAVQTEPESPTSATERDGVTLATIYPSLAPRLTIRWLPKALAKKLGCVYSLDESSLVAVSPGALRRKTVLHFNVARGKLGEIDLRLPADATVFKVEGEGVARWECSTEARAKRVHVKLAKPQTGRYDLRVWSARATDVPPAAATVRPVLDAQASHQRGYIAFVPDAAVSLREQGRRHATLFDVRTLDGDFAHVKLKARLAYHFDSAAASVTVQVNPKRAKVRATSATFVMLERGVATLRSRFDYEVRGAGVYQFRLRLDDGLTVIEVKGADIKDWAVKGNALTVSLRGKALGRRRIEVVSQQILRKVNGTVIPRIETADAEEETGYIGVSAGAGVYLQHHVAAKTRQVDISELPRWLRAKRPRLAYVYRVRGGSLAVSTVKVEAELTARLYTYVNVEAERVRRETLAVCKVRKAGIFGLRLRVPAGLVVTDVQGPLIDDWAVDEAGRELRVSFAKEVVGAYHFQLYTERMVSDLRAIPVGAVSLVGADKVEGWLGLGSRANLDLRADAPRGLTPLRLRAMPKMYLSYAGMALAYSFTERPWSLTLHAERVTPRIEANTFSILRFRQGNLAVETDINYSILKAGVSHFELELPGNAINSTISGDDTRSVELKGRRWLVDLDERKRGRYALHATYDVRLPTGVSQVAYTGVVALGAGKQTGKIAVCQQKADVEVSVAELAGVAPGDLTAAERRRLGAPLVAAYRYAVPRRRLTFAVAGQRLSDAMLQASIPSCTVHTLVKDDGFAVNYLTGTIQNVNKQFLTVTLDEAADLWGTYVGGKPVKPSRLGPGRYAVPLLSKSQRAHSVELMWSEPLPRLGWAGTLAFKTPQFDVQVQSTRWQVLAPTDYQIAGTGGNMEMVADRGRRATFLRVVGKFLRHVWRRWAPGGWVLCPLLVFGGIGLIVWWAVQRKRRLGYVLPHVVIAGPYRVAAAAGIIFVLLVLAVLLMPARRNRFAPPTTKLAGAVGQKAMPETSMEDLSAARKATPMRARKAISQEQTLGAQVQADVAQTRPSWVKAEETKEEEAEAPVDKLAEKRMRAKVRELQRKAWKKRRAAHAKQFYNMALAYMRNGNYAQAERGLKKAIKLDANLGDARQQLDRVQQMKALAKESLAQQQVQIAKDEDDMLRVKRLKLKKAGKPASSFMDALTEAANKVRAGRDAKTKAPIAPAKPNAAPMLQAAGLAGKQLPPPAPGQPREAKGRTRLVRSTGEAAGVAGPAPANEAKKRFMAGLAGNQLAAGSATLGRVAGGKAQGALPIALRIPTTGTIPYVFKKAFSGDRQAELSLRCVRVGAALTMQGGIFLVLCAMLVAGGLRRPRGAIIFAAVLALVFFMLHRFATPALRPYYESALAAVGLAVAIVLVQAAIAARRRPHRAA